MVGIVYIVCGGPDYLRQNRAQDAKGRNYYVIFGGLSLAKR